MGNKKKNQERKLKQGEKSYTSMPLTIKGVDKENYRLTMVASTQDIDRHGDTVIQSGWDLKPFSKNPVILNSHNYYDATEVIARAENTRIEGKGKRSKLIQDWVFAVEENPKAKIIFDLYAGKFLHASSVGFIPRKFAEKKDGTRDWFTIEEAELLEVSAVSVPANAYALAKSKGIDVDELPEEMIEEEGEVEEVEEETDTEVEEEEVEETPEEKKARLIREKEAIEAELKSFDDEDDGDDDMVSESGEFENEPVVPKAKKVSYKAQALKVIHKIDTEEKQAYRKVSAIINSILNEQTNGKASIHNHADKVRRRKVNQAIRLLIKHK